MSGEEPVSGEPEEEVEEFGAEMYAESARALRAVGARVALSIGAAVLIWIFGEMLFLPIAKEMTQKLMGYPVHSIISFIIVIALAVIIFTVFIDIRRVTKGAAGVLAYQLGKASGEMRVKTYQNYRTALDGVIYVIVVSLAYLLFADYLAEIHAAIPAIVLVLIVIWAIFALWRSCKAIADVIGKYTSQWAKELEKQAK